MDIIEIYQQNIQQLQEQITKNPSDLKQICAEIIQDYQEGLDDKDWVYLALIVSTLKSVKKRDTASLTPNFDLFPLHCLI